MKKTLLTLMLLLSATSAYADSCNGRNNDLTACMAEALQGQASAQHSLGMLYAGGWGVSQDSKEAVKWFIKSAKQGHVNSQYNLGMLYAEGKGDRVPQDYVMAHMFFNVSAANGNKKAINNRDKVAKKMTSLQIKKAQNLAKKWMEDHP